MLAADRPWPPVAGALWTSQQDNPLARKWAGWSMGVCPTLLDWPDTRRWLLGCSAMEIRGVLGVIQCVMLADLQLGVLARHSPTGRGGPPEAVHVQRDQRLVLCRLCATIGGAERRSRVDVGGPRRWSRAMHLVWMLPAALTGCMTDERFQEAFTDRRCRWHQRCGAPDTWEMEECAPRCCGSTTTPMGVDGRRRLGDPPELRVRPGGCPCLPKKARQTV